MARTILYSTDNYRVTLDMRPEHACTIVIFDFWDDHPSLLAEAPGGKFFFEMGNNVVGVKTAQNDWYQSVEMDTICQAVVAATEGHRRIGYGGSMGAYAAINFAANMQLEAVIAICPQFSIDPVKAPFERRWRTESRLIRFCRDDIDTASQNHHVGGYIIFDPCTIDRWHAERILLYHDFLSIRIRHGGHDQMLLLQQCGMLAGMLTDMVSCRFSLADWTATLRVRRRGSFVYWLNLAVAAAHRGWHGVWKRALMEARTLDDTGDLSFYWRFRSATTECLLAGVHGKTKLGQEEWPSKRLSQFTPSRSDITMIDPMPLTPEEMAAKLLLQQEALDQRAKDIAHLNAFLEKREAFVREGMGTFAALYQQMLEKQEAALARLTDEVARNAQCYQEINRLREMIERRDHEIARRDEIISNFQRRVIILPFTRLALRLLHRLRAH